MKIAILAPFEERVPPKKYGGTELIVSNLITELVRMGHDVTLFGTGDSEVPCKVEAIFPNPIRSIPPYDTDPKARESIKWVGIGKLVEKLQHESFDMVHNHIGWRLLALGNLIHQPMVTTLHGPMHLAYQHVGFAASPSYQFVSISDNQRKAFPNLQYVATVYNGIEIEKFPFSPDTGNYLFLLGRFSPEKGVKEAIEIAKITGMTLKIAAKIDLVDQPFYESLKSEIDGKQIQFIGEIGFTEKIELLKHAYALLAPIQWEEPFGLNVIEAMACGTPVIGSKRGSFPEIITHGVTGFLGSSVSELASFINEIHTIDRSVCRKAVAERFTSKTMAEGYVSVYQQVLQNFLKK